MTVVSLGVTAIHKCRSMSNTGRCLLWSPLRTQVRRRARQRQRLTQNQWRAMQERAPLTAISLPTLDRLSDRYQAASSCRVCYASLRTPFTTTPPGTGSSITSTIIVSVCRVLCWVGVLCRLEADFFATDRLGLAFVFCRFGFVLTKRFAACLFVVFALFATFVRAFALRAVARSVRLAITPSL
jgi:hypothetical protein